jgi:hypothetical protein
VASKEFRARYQSTRNIETKGTGSQLPELIHQRGEHGT